MHQSDALLFHFIDWDLFHFYLGETEFPLSKNIDHLPISEDEHQRKTTSKLHEKDYSDATMHPKFFCNASPEKVMKIPPVSNEIKKAWMANTEHPVWHLRMHALGFELVRNQTLRTIAYIKVYRKTY